MADLAAVTEVEAACFPAAEAATEADFAKRLAVYPNHFWLLEEDDGRLISFVNGMVTDEAELRDEMYADAALHDENGDWQMIFGVNTLPTHRRNGYAGMLIEKTVETAKKEKRLGVVLTCKKQLVSYYSKFGFVDEGISESKHGGEVWNQMRLTFD